MRFDYTKHILFSFKIKEIEFKFHVSVLAMIVLSAARLSSLSGAIISFIGFLLIVTIHELGHSFFVKLFKHKVYTIYLYFLGGSCEHELVFREKEKFWIAAGGVIFQLLLVILSLLVYNLLVYYNIHINKYLSYFLYQKLIFTNLLIIVFNLLPINGFDGHKIFQYLKSKKLVKKPKSQKGKGISNADLADCLIEARHRFKQSTEEIMN